jgi:hypothetical protein
MGVYRIFHSVLLAVTGTITLAACAPADGVLDPPVDAGDPVDSAVVGAVTVSRWPGVRGNTVTVLGSTERRFARARDKSGQAMCSGPYLGCSSVL